MTPAEFICRRSGDGDIERAQEIWSATRRDKILSNIGVGRAVASLRPLEWRDAAFFAFRRASGILMATLWCVPGAKNPMPDGAGDFSGTSFQIGRPHSTLILTTSILDAVDLAGRYSLPCWASGFRADDQLPALAEVDITDSVRLLIIAGRGNQDLEMGEAARRHSHRADIEYLWLDEGEENGGGDLQVPSLRNGVPHRTQTRPL